MFFQIAVIGDHLFCNWGESQLFVAGNINLYGLVSTKTAQRSDILNVEVEPTILVLLVRLERKGNIRRFADCAKRLVKPGKKLIV